MAFPQTVLELLVELNLGGVWTDVTPFVYRRDMVTIKRGRANEATRTEPSACALTFNNRDGRFSPRNPTGPYYGKLGRNTPIRISLKRGGTYLWLSATTGTTGSATAPDAAPLGIIGDIDIRLDAQLSNWQLTGGQNLAGKFATTGNQRSWALTTQGTGTGRLTYLWSTDGTLANQRFATSTAGVAGEAAPDGRLAVRVTHDVDNGASGTTVTFYTSTQIGGPWERLGDPVVAAGITSIFDSTAKLEVAAIAELPFGATLAVDRVLAFQLRNGINGTVVANPDFTVQTPGATSFADTASSPNTWTIAGQAELTNRQPRFHGEVSAWPPRWHVTGADVWVPIEAAGILRRLGQGAPTASPLYRAMTRLTLNPPVAYWPCEDATASTQLASAITGGQPLHIKGTPSLATFNTFTASAPLPQLKDSQWSGPVPDYPAPIHVALRLLLAVPAGGALNNETIITVLTSGTAADWAIVYGTGGTLKVLARDPDYAVVLDTGFLGFTVNGKMLHVSLELTQNGADVGWDISTLEQGQTTGSFFSGTLTGRTVGQALSVIVNPGGGLDDVAVGHITVHPATTTTFDLEGILAGHAGETAGRRVERLASEEGLVFRAAGDLDDTAAMGAQGRSPALTLIGECAETDGGVLFETFDMSGIGYRSRVSLYNQTGVELDYAADELAPPLEPTDDDQQTRNDVTASRPGGSSARYELEAGPLSVADPPAGVGRYDTSASVNVQTDEDLPDQAAWRVHLGTVDQARYPQITVNLARPQIAGDPVLAAAVAGLEAGDRLRIINPPPWLPPEPISQIVQGYTEELGNYEHDIVFTCSPALPYQVAVYGTPNLVVNGSFEVDATGWVAGGGAGTAIARSTAQKYAGVASLSVTRTASNPALFIYGAIGQSINGTGTQNKPRVITFYVYIPAASRPHVNAISFFATGLATTFVAGPPSAVPLPAADTWTRIDLTAVPTADLDNVEIQFWTDDAHTNGQLVAHIDAVSVRSGPPVSRYDTGGSELGAGATSTATTMTVAITAGPVWTTEVGQFPFDVEIGGERITVTAIVAAAGSNISEDFEDATLNITVTNGGNAAWARSTASFHGGAWSFKSGTIADSQSTDAIVTVPAGMASLQFWYRVSSEAGFDFLRVFVDTVLVLETSGAGSWTQSASFDVSAASTVTFRYVKDINTVAGEDSAYIDDLVFTSGPVQTFTVVRSANGVVKSHLAGSDVALFETPIYAL